MTIFQGSQGSISIFYPDLGGNPNRIVASAALTKKRPYTKLIAEANELVEDAVRSRGLSLKKISEMMLRAILYQKGYNKRFISEEDQFLTVISMIALVRLKVFEEEDVILVMCRKKARKVL